MEVKGSSAGLSITLIRSRCCVASTYLLIDYVHITLYLYERYVLVCEAPWKCLSQDRSALGIRETIGGVAEGPGPMVSWISLRGLRQSPLNKSEVFCFAVEAHGATQAASKTHLASLDSS